VTEDNEQKGLAEARPEPTLDYYVERRDGRKRNYIYRWKKAEGCPHPHLVNLAIGGNWYRCTECNYAFDIVSAYVQPLHSLVIGGMLNALHFAKEFGSESFMEVLRRPIGQYDSKAHKPVLPEGMTFWDALKALDQIDVNSEDQGKGQLQQMLEELWVGPKERALRAADQATQQKQQLEEGKVQNKALKGAQSDKRKAKASTKAVP
jgi:hypothetical protein